MNTWHLFRDKKKMSLASGLILMILIMFAGISVFNIMQRYAETILSNSLGASLQNKKHLFEEVISHGLYDAQTAASSLFLIRSLKQTNTSQYKNDGILGLSMAAENLLHRNFSAIVIYDNEANEVMRNGNISLEPAQVVSLETDSDIRAFLLWDKGFILRTFADVKNVEDQQVGSVMTERHLPTMTKVFSETSLINDAVDFVLCAPAKANNSELDCFLRGVENHEFKRVQPIVSNIPLPINYAMEGQSGIKFAKDYRQTSVVAAHSPMAFGLGMVLKVDEEELYYPIKEQFNTILLYLVVIMITGILMLRWLIVPFVRELIKSEKEMQKTNAELAAYFDAIGELALISVTDRKGRILKVNDQFCKVSGYSKEELIGQDHRILNSAIQPQEFFTKMWATIKRGDVWHDEICNRSKNGTKYWVDSAIVPIKNAKGLIDRYLSVRVDITKRKKIETILRERLKESVCLHKVRHVLGLDLTIDEALSKILDHLARAMQFSDLSAVMLEFDNQRFSSMGFNAENVNENASNGLHAQIVVNGKIRGKLEVYYIIDLPFLLPEENDLVGTIAHDISRWLEQKEGDDRIIKMATHDALTGLPNRHLLNDRIEQALAQHSLSQIQMAVLFIDLDHFKIINDSLGHATGDLLLQEVSKRLLFCVRAEDTVARQGGDEFIIVLRSIAQDSDASSVAQKILDILKQPFQINGRIMHIGCSIGISLFPADGKDAESLLTNSDIAMYYAKETGRNNFMLFTHDMHQLAEEKHDLSTDLRSALERNELTLYYQPVISMPNSELKSMEVLIRWEHPEKGLISPLKFIPLAEENGLIVAIGEWVLQTACEQIRTWKEQGYDVPKLAINLSAKQFSDDKLLDKIVCILDKTGVEAQSISLELTESTLIDNVEEVIKKLNLLTKLGLQVAIDDFGTGYSSLSYIKRFPINTLKIDRAFVQHITTDKNDNAIVTAIIAMADSLRLDVIAEGIETEEQFNLLIQHGCKRFQGYYFSKPLPTAEIENKLKEYQNYLSRKGRLSLVK
jgi:diguanylate cyclase (GGDEF)-like protein/PAS domain S-box-containing protein